ncbi:M14 family zinc carboxypeptidase [Salisaeta longa]|uniref:M14 family zinc carboxypeptidase n=1 Tax=Salisaeta longa TaxID=503170 RepID=UPI0003B70273|nr:M14 family zinc carboxypeptidase [Salisaeta longa]
MEDLQPTAWRQPSTFTTQADSLDRLEAACAASDHARYQHIGTSEGGRPLAGVVLGDGPRTVSLIAGNHADEPVGPATLRQLVLDACQHPEWFGDLFDAYTVLVVPHTNPDAEARNQPWISRWPDARAFLEHRVREQPGRDLEFGYPAMRPENEAVARFIRPHAPVALHMSLHGMAFAEGGLLLINRPWTFRTEALQAAFRAATARANLGLHDHNRKGEKGFFYIDKGFTTTPEGAAMRTFFEAQGNPAMAARFHDSSMEFVEGLGGDPLALVTELPLFRVHNAAPAPGRPTAYLRLKARIAQGASFEALTENFEWTPVPLETAVALQQQTIAAALRTVHAAG